MLTDIRTKKNKPFQKEIVFSQHYPAIISYRLRYYPFKKRTKDILNIVVVGAVDNAVPIIDKRWRYQNIFIESTWNAFH